MTDVTNQGGDPIEFVDDAPAEGVADDQNTDQVNDQADDDQTEESDWFAIPPHIRNSLCWDFQKLKAEVCKLLAAGWLKTYKSPRYGQMFMFDYKKYSRAAGAVIHERAWADARAAIEYQDNLPPEPPPKEPRTFKGGLRTAVMERDKYRCVVCGTHENLAVDHIVPWSKGGRTILENGQTLCTSCNARKNFESD